MTAAASPGNLLLQLRVKRRTLLHRYDDDSLHQLRVALRRVRSMLRHIDSVPAQTLRRELGRLADATNAARDWDTLASRAGASLKPRDFKSVRAWLEENRAAAHQQVLKMLRSDEWAQTMTRLEECIEHGELAAVGKRHGDGDIARARRDAGRAWSKVQSADDDKHWHKLRLAIKELRYTLDSVTGDSQRAPTSQLLKHCKRLQDALGTWHDTVVHVRMVEEFAHGLDRESEQELYDVLKKLCKRMEREARDALDDARSFLAGKGSDLLD
jgi:CHAD domain-containing protein